ncbi:hypothetical protein EMIT048CA2_10605 [Pseudomonas chlororaphis]
MLTLGSFQSAARVRPIIFNFRLRWFYFECSSLLDAYINSIFCSIEQLAALCNSLISIYSAAALANGFCLASLGKPEIRVPGAVASEATFECGFFYCNFLK